MSVARGHGGGGEMFRLQLRPPDDPDAFSPNLASVASEYAQRYLESIGVTPSSKTLEVVHKNAPLTEACIGTTLRAKGHVTDELHVALPPVQHNARVAPAISPSGYLQLGMVNAAMHAEAGAAGEAGASGDNQSHAGAGKDQSSVLAAVRQQGLPPVSSTDHAPAEPVTFTALAARYLHPFNLDVSAAKRDLLMVMAAGRQRTAAAGASEDGSTGDQEQSASGYQDTLSVRSHSTFDASAFPNVSKGSQPHFVSPRQRNPMPLTHGSTAAVSPLAKRHIRSALATPPGGLDHGSPVPASGLGQGSGAPYGLSPRQHALLAEHMHSISGMSRASGSNTGTASGYGFVHGPSNLSTYSNLGMLPEHPQEHGGEAAAAGRGRGVSLTGPGVVAGSSIKQALLAAGFGSTSANGYTSHLSLEMIEELLQEVVVTPEVVLTLQAELEAGLRGWFKNQAPQALEGRLSAAQFEATLALLASEGHVDFTITLLQFLHVDFIRRHPSYPIHLESLRPSTGLSAAPSFRQAPSFARSSSILARDRKGSSANMLNRQISRTRESMSQLAAAASGMGPGAGQLDSLLAHASSSQLSNLAKHDLGYSILVSEREAWELQKVLDAARARSATGALFEQPMSRSASGRVLDAVSGGSNSGINADGLSMKNAGGYGNSRDGEVSNSRTISAAAISALGLIETGQGSPAHSPHSNGPYGRSTSVRFDAALGSEGLGSISGHSGSLRPAVSHRKSGLSSQLALPSAMESLSASSFSQAQASSANLNLVLGSGAGNKPNGSFSFGAGGRAPGRSIQTLSLSAGSRGQAHQQQQQQDEDEEDDDSRDDGRQRLADLQQCRLFALHRSFARLFKSLRQTRHGMFFVLPVVLLAARLMANTLFTALCPIWTKSSEGWQAMEAMDASIVALFDPHGYLQRNLSMLQSSPNAVDILVKHPTKAHRPGREHFSDVSPMVAATLAHARAPGTRKMLLASKQQQAKAAAREGAVPTASHTSTNSRNETNASKSHKSSACSSSSKGRSSSPAAALQAARAMPHLAMPGAFDAAGLAYGTAGSAAAGGSSASAVPALVVTGGPKLGLQTDLTPSQRERLFREELMRSQGTPDATLARVVVPDFEGRPQFPVF